MRELQKVTDYWEVFQPDYDEPLLHYVGILAEKYMPISPEDFECGYYVSRATGVFAQKYLQGKIDKSKLNIYLEEIQDTVKAIGYDVEKFWYLLLFIDDFTKGVCQKGIEINESPKRQIEKFLKVLSHNTDNIRVKIVIEGVRPKVIIDNPKVLNWLSAVCGEEFEKVAEDKDFNLCATKNGLAPSPVANTVHICYFAKMFLKFFDLFKPQKQIIRDRYIPLRDKRVLISNLIHLMGLTYNVNFTDEHLQGYLSKDKDLKTNRININYL